MQSANMSETLKDMAYYRGGKCMRTTNLASFQTNHVYTQQKPEILAEYLVMKHEPHFSLIYCCTRCKLSADVRQHLSYNRRAAMEYADSAMPSLFLHIVVECLQNLAIVGPSKFRGDPQASQSRIWKVFRSIAVQKVSEHVRRKLLALSCYVRSNVQGEVLIVLRQLRGSVEQIREP